MNTTKPGRPSIAGTVFSWLLLIAFIATTNYRGYTGRLWWVWAVVIDTTFALAIGAVVVLGWYNRRQDLPADQITDGEIARLARSGDTVRAIRYYRTIHRAGLEEARRAVEEIAASPS